MRAALDSGCTILTAGAGCGKTTAVEQALSEGTSPCAWIGCSPAARSPGMFVMMIVDAISTAVPGSADALAETVSAVPARIDALAVTRELVAELSRLLVEPLVVVVDDAEHLDGADGSLRILDELLTAQVPLLRLVVAGRRPLGLRVAKARASGRLTELTAADLAFDAEECAELLRLRSGLDPPSERVEEIMEVTEGWPLARLRSESDRETALATRRLAVSLPPLRFEVLGRFDVRRGAWRAGDGAWHRSSRRWGSSPPRPRHDSRRGSLPANSSDR